MFRAPPAGGGSAATVVPLLCALAACALLSRPAVATGRLHATTMADGGAFAASESFRIKNQTVGQLFSGPAAGTTFRTDAGFGNTQVFDLSPPDPPVVRDGSGAEDVDEILGNAELCTGWTSADPQSGLFGALVGLGSAPGLDDVAARTQVGDSAATCLAGPFPYCQTYYFAVTPRNGSSLFGGEGVSDGFFLDDPVDPDGDELGNACDEDDDDDGLPDVLDPCPCDAANDADADGRCANDPVCGLETDNCPTVFNPLQQDGDADGIGDPCDSCPCDALNDADSDGVCAVDVSCGTTGDNCPARFNPSQQDSDQDGRGDACETDCVYYVGAQGGVADYSSIQTCVDAIPDGCRVVLRPGSFAENVTLSRAVWIRGEAGAAGTEIVGPGGQPVIRAQAATGRIRLDGLTLRGGSEGIRVLSDLDLADSWIDSGGTGLLVADDPAGPATPDVRVRTTGIAATDVGIRLERGALSLSRGWIRDAASVGVDVSAGSFEAASSLVTDVGGVGIQIGSSATAELAFTTVTACASGVVSANPTAGSVTIANSIVFGNLQAELTGVGCSDVVLSDTDPACCGQNGNLCADPLFADPAAQDYDLDPASPCVDAGFPPETFTGTPATDFAGRPRLLDADGDGLARPDCGAHERWMPPALDVSGLRFANPALLEWSPLPAADGFAVYRGSVATLGYDYVVECLSVAGMPNLWVGNSSPAPGQASFYLVSAIGDGGEGTLGFGSSAERSNFNPCQETGN